MTYTFRCNKCGQTRYITIPISKYNEEKNRQFCSNCKSTLQRVIEWEGSATNLGGYSDVGGRATWQV